MRKRIVWIRKWGKRIVWIRRWGTEQCEERDEEEKSVDKR